MSVAVPSPPVPMDGSRLGEPSSPGELASVWGDPDSVPSDGDADCWSLWSGVPSPLDALCSVGTGGCGDSGGEFWNSSTAISSASAPNQMVSNHEVAIGT